MAYLTACGMAGGEENVPTCACPPTYPDVGYEHWARDYVEYAIAQNVVTGYPDNTYRPQGEVYRAQMAVFLARAMVAPAGDAGLADYTPPADPTFDDVPSTHWAYKYVEYLNANGIETACSSEPLLFCPEDAIMAYDAASWVYQALGSVGDPCGIYPTAEFEASPETGGVSLEVTFTDLSTNSPTSWDWDFGDGGGSTAQNPTHTYTSQGQYTVSLAVCNDAGCDTETKTDYITVITAPVADFSASPTVGPTPLTVDFTDQSINSPASWDWDFGDGGGSTAQNPSHEYVISGSYTVSLTVINLGGSDTETKPDYITVEVVPPAADFSASPTIGTGPLTVDFTDLSSGEVTSWSWEFGDTTSSAEQHPSHQYTEVGSYTISLTAANAAGSNTETKAKYVAVMFPDADLDHWACEEILACVDAAIVSGYPDGTYHPELAVTRDQMAVYIARALAGGDENVPEFTDTPTFPDVDGTHWALKYVEYAVDQNVVAGYLDGSYHPEYQVTRDQMAVYVARALVAPEGEAGLADYTPADPRNFPDVASGFWAYTHVEYCVEHGVVAGYLDGLYHPEYVVTRDQMAVYVARAFGLAG